MLVIDVTFVLCGLCGFFIGQPNVAVVTITFFGLGAALATAAIIQKLRFHRPRPLQVEIVGGVPIRPSRIYYFTVGAAMTLLGVVFILSGAGYPDLFRFIGWPLAIAGSLTLTGLAIGWLPVGYLRFDPAGITVSRGSWAYTIPWDGISEITNRTLSDHHQFLLIRLRHDGVVRVHPPGRKRSLARHFAWNRHRGGAPVMILPSAYGMDLPLLIQALDRYVTVPSARAELSHRLLE